MTSVKTKWIYLLGFGGLLPFLGLSLSSLMTIELSLIGNPLPALVSYGAVILSFLSGILWGRALHRADTESTQGLIITSNVFALLAWLTLLLNTIFWSLLLQIVGFALVLFFERKLARGTTMTSQSRYYPMRLMLTVGVIVCQILVLGNHII